MYYNAQFNYFLHFSNSIWIYAIKYIIIPFSLVAAFSTFDTWFITTLGATTSIFVGVVAHHIDILAYKRNGRFGDGEFFQITTFGCLKCGCTKFLKGPEATGSINVECSNCGKKYNHHEPVGAHEL